jgi:hypothetical protein
MLEATAAIHARYWYRSTMNLTSHLCCIVLFYIFVSRACGVGDHLIKYRAIYSVRRNIGPLTVLLTGIKKKINSA